MRALALLLVAAVAGCTCKPDVMKVRPSLGVAPAGLDFGQVKVGHSKTLTLKLEAQTRTAVTISSITIEGGAAAAYRLGATPTQIDALGMGMFSVTFTPPAVAALTASVVIKSDDPDRATIKIALAGEGALPKLELTPDCQVSRMCTAMITTTPPAIDFGMEPLSRPVQLDPTKLPTLVIVNAGQVELDVSRAEITGPQGSAFSFATGVVPDGGVKLGAAEGFNLPVRFVPTDANVTSYAATVVIESDDPDRPSISVPLTGSLQPNAPPIACANLVRVVPQAAGESPRDYGSANDWAPLLMPPAGGYDFTPTRDVRPNELVQFSASSDATDVSKCSTDPEDGRMIAYRWRLIASPIGSTVALAGATTAQVQLRPVVTGSYTLELTVTDTRMSSTTVTAKFAVAVKQDLVVQLEWPGFSGVDLDLHLVRPTSITGNAFTGGFSFFNAGLSGKTAGDINGYAVRQKTANAGAGLDFDWGEPGDSDNPTLNVDDVGDGQLIENISLNFPEHDMKCDGGSCSYAVMVHSFRDARNAAAPPACFVDGGVGCADGQACGCASGFRCVAQSAPAATTPTGNGKCYAAPSARVKLFFRGSPTAANVIPLEGLMPPDEVLLGSPCSMWHVADISWPSIQATGSLPDGGTPPPVVTVVGADMANRITTPSFARFGVRAAGGSLVCDPDAMQGTISWYSQQP